MLARMPTDVHPEIAVVVSTYRRPESLRLLVEALAAQTLDWARWEAMIVDNGSNPPLAAEVAAIVAEAPFNARLLRIEDNHGPAAARNLGWRSSSAPLVAFTDDDCQPQPGWLEAGLATMAASPTVGVAQGRTVRAGGNEHYPYTPFTVIREVSRPSPWFEGCNLFLRRDALEAAGGFDESFGFFGEETSLGWTLVGAGWGRGWVHDAVVEHEVVERPWMWHVRFHQLEGNIVHLAGRYPAMRAMFWRPWAVKKENALFALAAVGLIGATRRRSALLLTVPYLRWLPAPWHPDVGWKGLAHQASLHAVSLASKMAANAKEGTFLL
jgi:GT2 family glycosyltransferase